MTREVTRAIDKKNGDEVIYRDDKIAFAGEASGATDITAQCEYLIKNGQTGEFMNVLKSYIDESVRSALGALVNNLDKGTTIKSVLATDSSNDLGSITPANLASVLGVHYISANLIFSSNGNAIIEISRDRKVIVLSAWSAIDGVIIIPYPAADSDIQGRNAWWFHAVYDGATGPVYTGGATVYVMYWIVP